MTAEALFKAKSKEFAKLFNIDALSLNIPEQQHTAVGIYCASIQAEAITNSLSEIKTVLESIDKAIRQEMEPKP